MTPPITGSAQSAIDRAAARRTDDTWLTTAWQDAAIIAVSNGQTMIHESTDSAPPRSVRYTPATAPHGERFFLGLDAEGTPHFAIAASRLPAPRPGQRHAGLRELAVLLPPEQCELLLHAIALDHWHRRHPRCARCGAATQIVDAGHRRACPACGAEHFPRTDPAVIMLVHDGADRCLLGQQRQWPSTRFSTLAGFVEPGESLEQAIAREVSEEVGINIASSRYFGSQPWPFPASLMLGFFAYAPFQEPVVDNNEISQAQWFTRAELATAVSSGALRLPTPISIAWSLIETWRSGEIT